MTKTSKEVNDIIKAADKLANEVELLIGKEVLNYTQIILALNDFRMAQINADEELSKELNDMLDKIKNWK